MCDSYLATHPCLLLFNCCFFCEQLLCCTPFTRVPRKRLCVDLELLQCWACTQICHSRALLEFQPRNKNIKEIGRTFKHQSREACITSVIYVYLHIYIYIYLYNWVRVLGHALVATVFIRLTNRLQMGWGGPSLVLGSHSSIERGSWHSCLKSVFAANSQYL